jgi:hypothetical protein
VSNLHCEVGKTGTFRGERTSVRAEPSKSEGRMTTVAEPVKGFRTQEPGQETPKPSAGTESGARPGGPAECR